MPRGLHSGACEILNIPLPVSYFVDSLWIVLACILHLLCCISALANHNTIFSLYLAEGFLHIQNLIGQAIVNWKSQNEVDVDVSIRVRFNCIHFCNNGYTITHVPHDDYIYNS